MCIVNYFLDGALSELNTTQKMITNKRLSSTENILLHPVKFLRSTTFAVQGNLGNDGMTMHCYSDYHLCRVGQQWNLLMSVLASKQTLIFLTFTQYCSNTTVLENYIALSSPNNTDQLKNRQKTALKWNSNRLI